MRVVLARKCVVYGQEVKITDQEMRGTLETSKTFYLLAGDMGSLYPLGSRRTLLTCSSLVNLGEIKQHTYVLNWMEGKMDGRMEG